jgi:hypothetical protein
MIMSYFRPFWFLVQKPNLNAKNQFNQSGLIGQKKDQKNMLIKPLFDDRVKLLKPLVKPLFIYVKAFFNNWFKLVLTTGLN